MTVKECRDIINGLKDADDLPVKLRVEDQMGAEKLVDLGAVEERTTHGKEAVRQIVLSAK